MNNKISRTVCAATLAMGVSFSANADIVDISFSGYGNVMQYAFDVQVSAFTEGDLTYYTSNETFLSASFNGVVFDAANYSFQFSPGPNNNLLTAFELSDNTGVVSSLTFEGFAGFVGDTTNPDDLYFEMDYYGRNPNELFNGLNYQIVVGGFDNNVYLATGTVPGLNPVYEFTQVDVATTVSAVPVPAAVWLFASGIIGLAGVARRRA